MSDLDPVLRGALDSLEGIQRSLEALNASPNVTPTAGPADNGNEPVRKLMTTSEMYAVRQELKKKSLGELFTMFGVQARRRDVGIPFEVWAASGGAPAYSAIGQNELLTKALDTSGGQALIRQDLEPILYELFVREFPAWDRFAKEPANGLIHAFDQVTAYGDAQFMTELGTVTDDKSTYVRESTNVAILATRRGITLKQQFATLQSGSGFNPEQLELQNGLRAIAHKMQKTIFQGNASVSGGTASTEDGAYDANGFTGLRHILNQTQAKDVDPTGATPEDMRAAIDEAALEVMNAGGRVNIIWLRPDEKVTFDLQQDKNVRYMNSFVDVAVGVQTNAVNTVFGPLPLATVPGDSIGHYTRSSVDVADMYLLDEGTISLPYLGSPGPTTLDIPIGISGQLSHLYIIFGMWGLAVKALPFSNKVRVTL
jgi:hypothetical protein